MKKHLRLLLCLSLLLQNFSFVIPVFAENTPKIKIIGVQQGDSDLTKEGDNYIVNGFERLFLKYDIENFNENDTYYISIKEKDSYNSITEEYSEDKIMSIQNLNQNLEIIPYEVLLCKDMECNTIYNTESFNIKFSYFNEIKDSKIYITDVSQGGKKLELSNSDYVSNFNINNKENITFTLKGENLVDNATYYFNYGLYNDRIELLGSEIETGVEVTHPTNLLGYHHFDVKIDGIGFNYNVYYYDGANYYYYNFNVTEDETIPTYDSKLIYTNYNDIEIEQTDDINFEYYVIGNKYLNENNSLSYYISGSGYENKDYPINIEVKKDKQTIYEKNFNVNGLLINNGYSLELDNLELELNEAIENASIYTFDISVGNVISRMSAKYNSTGKDARVDAEIFFENGKKNLSTFMGNGNEFYNSGVAETNKDAFEKYSSIYLNFYGVNFLDDVEYDYVLEYGYYGQFYDGDERVLEIELEKGTISGKILNNVGLLYKLDNYKNYENPMYRMTIKKGNEVIYSSGPILRVVSSPTLANASLSAKSKNLYLRTSDYSYVATRNAPLDIVISGLGFDENTIYPFEFCYYESGKNEDNCETINIKGKDLNDGTAKIKFDQKIDSSVESYDFYVYSDANNYQEKVAIQGGFEVTFVDSKDLFPSMNRYVVDNVSDLIKNIKKNTSVKDFTYNIEVVDNGKVKVFDKTGTTEITGNVGTGMIARVVNEYDQNILDMDVVVKGDVSGDGNISITDLVNVAQHIADVESLNGVYEVAANVTDSGTVGITDLVQISQDVAGIKEVQ